MAQTVQIKRSTASAAPATLAQGELAYSHGSMTFYVGSPQLSNTPIPIGGAIINNAGTPTLATGVTGAEVRSLIGAGTGDGTITDQPAVIDSAGTPTLNAGITAAEIRTLIDVDVANTDNSTPVTVTESVGYVSFVSGTQAFTFNNIATTDFTDFTGDVRAQFSGGTGVDITTGTISIGQAVGTSDNVTFNNIIANGDLTVNGTTTTINTTELLVEDNLITLNSGEAGVPSQNAGIEIERGTSTNVALRWNETSDLWEVTTDGTTYNALVTSATQGGVSSVSVTSPITDGGTASVPDIGLDLSLLTDMTAAAVGTDEMVLLDGGAQRRKAFSEIDLSIFNNDLTLTTTLDGLTDTTITTNTAGEILKWSGTAWINNTLAEANIQAADGNVAWSRITTTPTTLAGYGITDAATSAQGALAATAIQTITLSSTDGSITGVGASSGTTPSFDLEVGTIDGGTY